MSIVRAAGAIVLAVAGTAAAQTTFTNVTQDVGLGQFTYTMPPGQPVEGQIRKFGGGAIGDFDRDGWPDIYICGGGGQPDALFMNNRDGTFTNRAEEWGLTELHIGGSPAVGDFNSDGWLDIYVTSLGLPPKPFAIGQHKLFVNNGQGGFVDRAVQFGVHVSNPNRAEGTGAAWGDYDLDGDLDLCVTGWLFREIGNRLFRNDGGTFTDVTASAGVFPPDLDVRGFAPYFIDMNGDRYPELLIAADYETSKFYLNNGDGTFTDATDDTGTGLDGNGMGQAVADFNNDGMLDWYVTSIYTPDPFGQVPGTGNFLYTATGPLAYVDTAGPAGLKDTGWGWGAVATDLDNDGDQDLISTNGWDNKEEFTGEKTYLHFNNGDTTFTEQAEPAGLQHYGEGRGMARFDYDLDGDQDVIIFSDVDPVHLYRNELNPSTRLGANWLQIALDTDGDARIAPDGMGAFIRVTSNGQTQLSFIAGGCNYLSQDELVAHFGLGFAATATVEVTWPNGVVTTKTDVAANQRLIITYCRADFNTDGVVDVRDKRDFLALFGAQHPDADFNGDGTVTNADRVAFLNAWRAGCP